MLRLARRPPAWETAVRMAAAGGVFVGGFFCAVFSRSMSLSGSRIELCLFLRIFLLTITTSRANLIEWKPFYASRCDTMIRHDQC